MSRLREILVPAAILTVGAACVAGMYQLRTEDGHNVSEEGLPLAPGSPLDSGVTADGGEEPELKMDDAPRGFVQNVLAGLEECSEMAGMRCHASDIEGGENITCSDFSFATTMQAIPREEDRSVDLMAVSATRKEGRVRLTPGPVAAYPVWLTSNMDTICEAMTNTGRELNTMLCPTESGLVNGCEDWLATLAEERARGYLAVEAGNTIVADWAQRRGLEATTEELPERAYINPGGETPYRFIIDGVEVEVDCEVPELDGSAQCEAKFYTDNIEFAASAWLHASNVDKELDSAAHIAGILD